MNHVVRTDGTIEPFDRQRIVDSLQKETTLCEELFDVPGASPFQANQISVLVENACNSLMTRTVTSHTIREILCSILIEQNKEPFLSWYRVCTRVGMPVYDAWQIDHGEGFESHDNANLKGNAETSHKKKADKLSKEQNLLLMPIDLAMMHNSGDFHIHDLEYFGTRPFCSDQDLRYIFYYGLIPSGEASTSAVAKPAQKAEVAILHAVKAMGSAQTNFAGGQGFYNFLTFLAPYLVCKDYDEIKQLMQMFVYEMMQMYVARACKSFNSLCYYNIL
jgi:Oxygen-sensitive ribonucleoside-triphosphate reductase